MEIGGCQCGGYFVASNPKSHDWTSKDSWKSAVELYSSLDLTVEPHCRFSSNPMGLAKRELPGIAS
jgi:hypothetical protein